MKKSENKGSWIKGALIVPGVLGLFAGGYLANVYYRYRRVQGMSYDDVFSYVLDNNENAILSIGILKDGQESYHVYGNNGEVLSDEEHVYEIGSVTKTFNTSLLMKAILEGKASLDDSISKYLSLPQDEYYPDFKRLVTHTSGYKNIYLDDTLFRNIAAGNNSLSDIDRDTIRKQVMNRKMKDKVYPFIYSNFGMSVIGLALEQIYQKDYTELMNAYIADDLQLKNTRVSDGTGDLEGYWDWKENDGYLPAGSLVSTIGDVMQYVRMNMYEERPYLTKTHDEILYVGATNTQFDHVNLRMDGMGIGWILDKEHDFIWHNGGTAGFNCYVAFDKVKKVGVVILSNLGPNVRIPATIMGIKLMTELQAGKR